MKFTVNNQVLQYESEGDRAWGPDSVMLEDDIDLTALTPWSAKGYTIESLFDAERYATFRLNTNLLLNKCWLEAGIITSPVSDLTLYHQWANTIEKHLAAVDKTKLLSVNDFPVPIHLLEDRISKACHASLEVKNPYDNQSVFHFRVIRPNQPDNNPLHRDVWLEDYKDCINLYIPVAGSNENSSLVLVPGSHRWPESWVEKTVRGAKINQVKFNVPAVTSLKNEAGFVRPLPDENEVLIFSPYLIHGGAYNSNINTTRISIEIRLWKKS